MRYFTLHDVLTRGCPLNYIISLRGGGKTYSFKKWAIKDFLRTGSHSVYLRRRDDEFETVDVLYDDVVEDFNNDPKNEFNIQVRTKKYKFHICKYPKDLIIEEEDVNFFYFKHPTYEKELGNYYLDLNEYELDETGKVKKPKMPKLSKFKKEWAVFGMYFPLAEQQKYKGLVSRKCNKICYDEFILENEEHRYIPDEANKLMNLWNTIDRYRDVVKVVCFSNAGMLANPHFTNYGVKYTDFSNTNYKFIKGHDNNKNMVLFHMWENEEMSKEYSKSNIGQIGVKNYLDYAIGNKFSDVDGQFILPKRPKKYTYLFTITDGQHHINIYNPMDYNFNNVLWVDDIDKEVKNANLISCNPSKPIENAPYKKQIIKMLRDKTHECLITYKSYESRNTFYDLIKP